MPKNNMNEFQSLQAKDRQEWREWLNNNHNSSSGVWIIYYKKGAQKTGISYEEAVEEALSFGWIDSKVNALDEERYMQVFTPRKKGSIWSKLNKERVKKIIKMGIMTPAGLEKVEAAKEDGSWNILDDIEDLNIPDDLQKALDSNKNARNHFDGFSDSVKKQTNIMVDSQCQAS